MISLPLTFAPPDDLYGATSFDLAKFYQSTDPIRQIEIAGISEFVHLHSDLLTGRVLDFGCGKPGTCRTPQPFRHLIKGEYVGVDVGDPVPEGPYDAILCTEVLAYVLGPHDTIFDFYRLLRPGGALVITYTAAWPENEADSLWRFTCAGMAHLLRHNGFEQLRHTLLAEIKVAGNRFPLGHGHVARRGRAE